MRDRHVLETVLIRRFPGAGRDQIAAAANAIMALLDQWLADELTPATPSLDGSGGDHRDTRHRPAVGH